MMSKILFLGLLISGSVMSQDGSEQAIILNEELQFLQDSANEVSIITSSSAPTRAFEAPSESGLSREGESLESQYFTDTKDDEVTTKKAAPLRRGF